MRVSEGCRSTAFGAKRPFIRKTAFGPMPRQMVFKQTIEEDIVGSTGVVKGGSAAPLLPRPAHPVFDLASGQPEIAEHAVVQLGELGRSAAGSGSDRYSRCIEEAAAMRIDFFRYRVSPIRLEGLDSSSAAETLLIDGGPNNA
jgi:hypothetical protein